MIGSELYLFSSNLPYSGIQTINTHLEGGRSNIYPNSGSSRYHENSLSTPANDSLPEESKNNSIGIYLDQSPEGPSGKYKDSLLSKIRQIKTRWDEYSKEHPTRSNAIKMGVLVGAGAVIGLVLYNNFASSPYGYSVTRLPSYPEQIVKELRLNPILHPIKEGIFKFVQEVGSKLGPVKIYLNNTQIPPLEGVSGVSIEELIEDQVSKSTARNRSWHVLLGELTSFGAYGVKKIGERVYRVVKGK